MARVTVEECLENVANRFELVLVAAKRAHQLNSGGYKSLLENNKDKAGVIALREIEAGLIDSSILTEESEMGAELSLEQKAADHTKITEIEEELSTTAVDEIVDQITEIKE